MQIYLVRAFETQEIAGIFWACNLTALWDIVDQMGDPAFFEYKTVNSYGGGLYTSVPIGRGQNPALIDWERDEINWSGFSPDEFLSEDIANWNSGRRWNRFDTFDVGHGRGAQLKRLAA